VFSTNLSIKPKRIEPNINYQLIFKRTDKEINNDRFITPVNFLRRIKYPIPEKRKTQKHRQAPDLELPAVNGVIQIVRK